ncbi:MAG: acetyl-CoA hydrolase/transferase C-terminal domain-containing protein, partial [Candidatus Gracilibacteria bacterium]
ILKTGGRIIFEVNEALPYAAGEELDLKKLQGKKESLSAVHVSFVIGVNNLDMMIPGEKTLTKNGKKSSKAQMQEAIARHVANLIQDGDTVQCGIGEIPAEVLKHLRDAHTNVDIYTEVIADGIIDYFDPETEGGRMNMERFIREGRKVVLGFAVGSRRLIEFVGRYPQLFEFRRSLHVNAPANVAAIPNFKAVNGATEVTMGGQVMAFTVNGSALSGIGGQGDMATGALGGHTRRPNDTSASIIVLPSMRQETFVYDSAEVIPEDRYVVPPGESDLRLYYRPQKNNNPVAIPDGKVKVKVWVSKVVLGPGLDATTQRMGQLAHLVTENGVTPRLHHLSVGHRICEIIKLAHPAFKKGLVEGAQAQGWLSNIDLDQEIPGWNTWEEGE